ncbi:hypothetical protein AAZX31_03G054400 [Glycine max]|uniref:Uncharacterized protein n=1 Tax=Glycine max TaxID=3847 RepID=K7KD95_SOYBN|nr:UPF0481 protein At3g47200 [Glycine max]KAG5054184.1 hypothetical protein JHK85_006694 [Glycine max]KAG5071296.1 hypothetical protein JHK86_006507 [Glycine max]KAH1068804.1 hypothetical protein GYH30_006393 [Glycine max]KAH1256737.1 UPF0481 protein [Glycine max]KRH65813.1 hypothetical protein GLYMA_03G063400v4 [Glycine max]|eukprot:XP_006577486.1 UPF0481 protein At3g47200 [Glycine max]
MTQQPDFSWMVPIEVMLGALYHGQVQACSISSVTDELRSPNEAAFKPKEVSIGPLHRGTTRHVQLMEETKWHYMREFLDRRGTQEQNRRSERRLRECGTDILKLDKIIMACYGGNIRSEPQELAKIMIVDGCFLLELLIRLGDFICNNSSSYANDPILKNEEKMVSVLNDITLLENQIPFIVLKKLYRKVFPDGSDINNDNRVADIVCKAFGYTEVKAPVHILHLMHLSTVEQTQQEGKRVEQELLRCATRLQAAGVEIKAANTIARHKLVDWFNFEISFSDSVLRIPPLYVKDTTEVRWRNLIAWEQSRIWIRCKYTSYALFFQGLVCCKHDIELLEKNGVIVNKAGKSTDELLDLFRTIAKGAEYMDSSYSEIGARLNMYNRGKITTAFQGLPVVTWHKCRHVLQIIVYYWGNWYRILIRDHIPTVWKFIGVLAAAALLVLTIMQTYYSSRNKD